jgi:hypothetical protein
MMGDEQLLAGNGCDQKVPLSSTNLSLDAKLDANTIFRRALTRCAKILTRCATEVRPVILQTMEPRMKPWPGSGPASRHGLSHVLTADSKIMW